MTDKIIRFNRPLIALLIVLGSSYFSNRSVSAESTTPQAVTLTVDNNDDDLIACFRETSTTCFCDDADANDCGLRQAIEKANDIGSDVNIVFLDSFLIQLNHTLPVITASNVTINGNASGERVVIDGNGRQFGFRIEAAEVTLHALDMVGFSGSYVLVDSAGDYAEIWQMNLTGPGCSNAASGSAVGIKVVGSSTASAGKAYLYQNTICGMGGAGILLDGTERLNIGRKPLLHEQFTDRNILTHNGVGLRINNSCNIFEYFSEITDNVNEGIHVSAKSACNFMRLQRHIVERNGGTGILVDRDHNNFSSIRVIPFSVEDNSGLPLILDYGFVPFRPYVLWYNEPDNTMHVRFANTATALYVYDTSGDPDENGGGGTIIDTISLSSQALGHTIDLDDYHSLTPTEVSFIVDYNGLKTSEFSELYEPAPPTAVSLSAQSNSALAPRLLLLAIVMGLVGVTTGVYARKRTVL